jgi:hypothetical protein
MADENPPVTTPATGAPQTTPATGTEPAAPSHRDWNAMAQNTRQTNETMQRLASSLEAVLGKMVSPGSGTQPAPAPAAAQATPTITAPADAGVTERLVRLERDLAVKSAIADYGLSGDQRTAFEEMAAMVPSDRIAAIAEKVSRLKPAAAAAMAAVSSATAPVATAPTVKPGSTNTGAAAPASAPIVPDRIEDIPREVWKQMTPAEQRQKYEAMKRANGQGNPFAAPRK